MVLTIRKTMMMTTKRMDCHEVQRKRDRKVTGESMEKRRESKLTGKGGRRQMEGGMWESKQSKEKQCTLVQKS